MMNWKKSTRSGPYTDNCVEVAYTKATASGNNGSCVEAHQHNGEIHVRDSKNPDAGFLTFTGPEWKAFVEGVNLGEFNYDLV